MLTVSPPKNDLSWSIAGKVARLREEVAGTNDQVHAGWDGTGSFLLAREL